MRVLRRRHDNIVQFISFGFLAVAFVAVRPGAVTLLAAPLAVLAVRALRAGVFIADDEVLVRNTFSTHRIGRADVAGVALARAGRSIVPAVVIRRHDGPPVPLWCVMPSGRRRRTEEAVQPLINELRDALTS